MYAVNDPIPDRLQRINDRIAEDPGVAVLMAAAHFEWVCRRAIIALGCSPTAQMRKNKVFGLGKYKALWNKEISRRLEDIPSLPDTVPDWPELGKAFKTRNVLIHGVETCSMKFAANKVEIILEASEAVRRICTNHGINLNQRLPVRKIPRQP